MQNLHLHNTNLNITWYKKLFELNKIYEGNSLEVLKEFPDQSIHTCITSPPYFGLRDYGVSGQIGLEQSPEEFVQNLVNIFKEVKRVLRDDGTVWLNIGDSYAGNNSRASNNGRAGFGNPREMVVNRVPIGAKPKDLIGIPWRVAFALQRDGWYLRQDIIWHKPNPMPESVADRCTKSHEYIFLLSKNDRYYFDNEAIKEPAKPDTSVRDRDNTKMNNTPGRIKMNGLKTNHYKMRNKRSVWTVTTKPYKEAHFATFPEDLIQPCVLAGCPKDGVVLDPFMGSGTTASVAIKNNRNYVGIELNPEYIQLAEKRLKPVKKNKLEIQHTTKIVNKYWE